MAPLKERVGAVSGKVRQSFADILLAGPIIVLR